jgi:hypothetical protein
MINVHLYAHMYRKLGNSFKIFVSIRSVLSKVRERMSIREKEYDQSTLYECTHKQIYVIKYHKETVHFV